MIEKSIAGEGWRNAKRETRNLKKKKKKKAKLQNGAEINPVKKPLKRKKENVFETNPTWRSKFNLH